MPKKIIAPLLILCATLFIAGGANASWLDKLKDTASELTDKAAEALKEAEPESPTTSDGEGQAKKPATTTAPAAPKAPAQSTVTAPSAPKTTAPAPAAPGGNNDKALVMATQEELKRLGYKIGVDGAYGPNTKKQIISFQNSQNMAATGNVTPDLVAALKATPTPNTEPATTTTTTVAPAPKAEEPKVEKAAAPAAATPSGDVLTAIFEKDEKYNGGRLAVEYPRGAQGQTEYFSVRWLITNNNEKYAEIAPVGQMRGKFKAWINTANNNYAFEGLCDISCPRSVPEAQWAQVYDEFAALSETGGSFEFTIETNETFGPFKVTVPAANGSTQAKTTPAAAPAPATPKKSLNPHDYDRVYPYEGKEQAFQGQWYLDKTSATTDGDRPRFNAEIGGDELNVYQDLRNLKRQPGVNDNIKKLMINVFRKSDNYNPPSAIRIRFDGTEIITKNVTTYFSMSIKFQATGKDVVNLLDHVRNGGNFEYRLENFEPFLYSKDWTTFSSPPPEIAAAKQAEKDKQAAAMAAQQAAQEKKAAYAGTLSPEGKVIYENCEQNYSTKNHYDCQCIAANSESYIGPAIDSRTEGLKTLIAAKEGAIKKNNANPNLTAEKKAQSENALRARIAKEQAEIKKIEDRANWDNNMRHAIVNSIEINIYQESTCKVGEGWREKEYKTCMSATTLNNIKGNKTPEEFCSCSADTVAKLWTSSTQSFSSKVAVGLPVQARTQCRN